MLERERPRDSSFNEGNESIAEQLNYCLMGKRNMLSRLSAAMLPGLGQRGELGAALAPEGRVANQHPGDPRSRQVPPRGDQSLASNWYWQPQFGPNLAQSLSPSKRLTLPRLFYHPGCRQPAPALLHAPDTLPGQHGPPLRRCPRQERGDRAGESRWPLALAHGSLGPAAGWGGSPKDPLNQGGEAMPGDGACEFGIFWVTGEKPLLVTVVAGEGACGQEGVCRGSDTGGGFMDQHRGKRCPWGRTACCWLGGFGVPRADSVPLPCSRTSSSA